MLRSKKLTARKSAVPATEPLLIRVGERIRNLRAVRGMSRKMLARDAGVSERFLADLESGVGNASILLLNRLAEALAMPLAELVTAGNEDRPDLHLVIRQLSSLTDADLQESHRWLQSRFALNASRSVRLSRTPASSARSSRRKTTTPMSRLTVPDCANRLPKTSGGSRHEC